MSIKAGVVGAAGFAGIEAVRLLSAHPEFDLVAITSSELAGTRLADAYPAFEGVSDLRFLAHDDPALDACDVVFLAVPHTAALAAAPGYIARGISVIDLSADFRLKDPAVYERWYKVPHTQTELLARAAFGLPELTGDELARAAAERALEYMDLKAGTPMREIAVNTVFIGSCTNGRIEDLRAAASVVKGRHKADGVRVMVVPGSARVRLQAEAEGLDKIFTDFGAEWRNAGCSMCLGMNPDTMDAGDRSASTSNRNFEGRQGKGSRTHLVSPLVAAATAVRGTLSSPADL